MSESKKVALPAYLPRRLQAFRIVQGDTTSYLLRDKLADKTHDLEPWQFFVLEVLPGCETIGKLLSVFEDRFGRQLTEAEVMKFFGWLADNKLLDEESAAHPLLKPFTKQSYALEHGLVKPKSFEELATIDGAGDDDAGVGVRSRRTSEAKEGVPEDATLAAGVNEAENLDPARRRAGLEAVRDQADAGGAAAAGVAAEVGRLPAALPRPVGADPGRFATRRLAVRRTWRR